MYLHWAKGADGEWCRLDRVSTSALPANGIYVIWKPGPCLALEPRTIKVAQGNVAQRLATDRLDPAVTSHGPDLLVTWATAGLLSLDGIELFLTQRLRPLVDARYPLAVPIEVNVPVAA